MSKNRQWMIYGANGYTGELIARQAVAQGLRPVLAGRGKEAIATLAGSLDLPARIFTLDDSVTTRKCLSDMHLVVHCAGPFSATSAPMVEACIGGGVHYVDITGEIDVFRACHAAHEAAVAAGVVVCPGVGFDVIPTDCVAACLAEALPDTTHLALGFDSHMQLSRGTAKTSVEGLKKGGVVRRDGRVQRVGLAASHRRIDFGGGPKNAVTIPWGDVATAYYSTGIANIEVYIPMSPRRAQKLRRLNWIRSLLGLPWVQTYLKRRIERGTPGPDARARAATGTQVWGEARNAAGDIRTAQLRTANGYEVTIHGALMAAAFLCDYEGVGGYFTPSALFGKRIIESFPGSGRITLSAAATESGK